MKTILNVCIVHALIKKNDNLIILMKYMHENNYLFLTFKAKYMLK